MHDAAKDFQAAFIVANLGARTLAHGADAYLQLQMGFSLDIIKPLVARNPRRG
jgi:hypothetical protein